jgi:hypothetical protein
MSVGGRSKLEKLEKLRETRGARRPGGARLEQLNRGARWR